MKIYLLQTHQGHNAGEIVEVSTNVAFGLLDSGKGRKTETRDFLVKPEKSNTIINAEMKAFKEPPSKHTYTKRTYTKRKK